MASYDSFSSQRVSFKLLETLTSQNFTSELDMLRSLVNEIVNHKEFQVLGGRIWELDPQESCYFLRYQFGNVKQIPENYRTDLSDNEIFGKLVKQRVLLNFETDELLIESGIGLYSATGVGEIIKLRSGKYFKYILGFNAPEILQSFYETLNIINSVASLHLRELSMLAKEEKTHKDILKASEIQRNLLPEHKLRFHDFDIYGICTSASFVGGDYFDYIKNSDEEDERLGIVVCDCASKGLPAAIQALFVSGAIRMAMSFSIRISQFLVRLNNLIFDTFTYERFVTLFYLELTLSSNRLVLFANAGHPPAIHYSRKKDRFKLLKSTGGFLGLMQNQKFAVENIAMKTGDILLVYTDGITEARDKDGNLFGEEPLFKLIKEYKDETSEIITMRIVEAVQIYTAGSDFADDQTLVLIKRTEEDIETVKVASIKS
jgi:sigma-B regulation protein RsbU (phosphoserine phosphatase)